MMLLQRAFSIVLCASLVMSPAWAEEIAKPVPTPTSPAQATSPPAFIIPEDVPLKPDQDILANLMKKGFFNPFPDNRFQPETPISRAEFVTLLYRASELKTPFVSEFAYFRDVPTDHWAYVAIEGLRIRQLLHGDNTGYFNPDAPVTRLEAGILLSETLPPGWLSLSPTEIDKTLAAYPDTANQISIHSQEDIARSIYAGLLAPISQLSDNKQSVQLVMDLPSPLSRIEAARMIYRRMDMSEESHRPQVEQTLRVPAGATLTLSPTSAISRERISVGEPLYFSLVENTEVSPGGLVLPRGSQVHGLITEITSNRLMATVTLDKMRFPSGEFYKLGGSLFLQFNDRDKEGGFLVPGQNLTVQTQSTP